MSEKMHQKKAAEVTALVQKLKACQSFLIYEYAGFTANESSQLRSQLKRAGAEMTVYKNNILNRSLVESGIISDANLSGPNALVLGTEDIEPLKAIAKMGDKKTFIKLKVAFVDNNVLSGDALKNFATLPTKKDLYAMLCQCLQSPLRKLMHVIKSVGESKQ